MSKLKIVFTYIGAGLILPAILLFNAFIIPEPESHPLLNLALAPKYLMPFLNDTEFMNQATLFLFSKPSIHNSGVLIIFLVLFWFIVSAGIFHFIKTYKINKQNTQAA